MKKLLAILLALIMMLTTVSAMAAAAPEKWDISKSKTATNLDANYESKVTLSLPSAEEPLVSDIVFVLDKSTSAQLEQQALDMLEKLKAHVEETGATVKVGVVIFNKVANVANDGKFFNLATEYDGIEAAIKQEVKSGTNTHAGLLAGKKMLDDDKSVENNRKYLIFVSDGITYMYNAEPTVTAWKFNMPNSSGDWYGKGSWGVFAGPDNWYSKYHKVEAPGNWDEWMQGIGSKISDQGTKYEYPYGGEVREATPEDITNWDTAYAMSIDKALYLTKQVYQEAKDLGYNVYAMTADSDTGKNYIWGPSFMNYLAGNDEVNFEKIKNDILYLVGPGSTVTDRMGKTADYDFDFINSAANLSLKVDETAYAVSAKTESLNEHETARYLFTSDGVVAANQAEAPFVLHYYAKGTDGASDECFVWDINVPVSNFAPVQLTYAVKLTNPKTASGTYGTYDKDGSKNYEGLYTNNSAVLRPVNSNNIKGAEEDFNKPTVDYTVSGGGGGHTHYDPTPSVPVVVVVPPKTGDMPLWYGIARFLGLVK
ncbi:MAG: VWA domain-containing protein [Clostridiales bacterium]|nr:VWA domain-containing protein [Clostridiales bacterium]